jgi:hypothetical protein
VSIRTIKKTRITEIPSPIHGRDKRGAKRTNKKKSINDSILLNSRSKGENDTRRHHEKEYKGNKKSERSNSATKQLQGGMDSNQSRLIEVTFGSISELKNKRTTKRTIQPALKINHNKATNRRQSTWTFPSHKTERCCNRRQWQDSDQDNTE